MTRKDLWPPEREQMLRELWAKGLRASEIAKRMGCFSHCQDGGRLAVVGKAHRLGLAGRRSGEAAGWAKGAKYVAPKSTPWKPGDPKPGARA